MKPSDSIFYTFGTIPPPSVAEEIGELGDPVTLTLIPADENHLASEDGISIDGELTMNGNLYTFRSGSFSISFAKSAVIDFICEDRSVGQFGTQVIVLLPD